MDFLVSPDVLVNLMTDFLVFAVLLEKSQMDSLSFAVLLMTDFLVFAVLVVVVLVKNAIAIVNANAKANSKIQIESLPSSVLLAKAWLNFFSLAASASSSSSSSAS